MWFRRHERAPEQPGDAHELSGAWHDSDLTDEVAAFLEGRLVDFYTFKGRLLPAWLALNRLAHADHSELVRLVSGAARGSIRSPWAATERFIAARVLAQAPTPKLLDQIQSQVLVPIELKMVVQTKVEASTASRSSPPP